MDYLNTNLKWEDFFVKESLTIDEKILSFDTQDLTNLGKSKIRLAIEHQVLNWEKYETWMLENMGCASFKNDVNENIFKKFIANSQQAYEAYSNYDFWNEDLLPMFIWEDQLIVFGLQYNENLEKIKDHIFILAHPDILNYFVNIILKKETEESDTDHSDESDSDTVSKIEGLDMEIKPPDLGGLNFKSIGTEPTIWDFITERHDEYSFEAKKQFGAYIVLKIEGDVTKVFKMDPDLKNANINEDSLSYNLKQENPFSRVLTTGISDSFNVSQLGLEGVNYKYACITALKRAEKIVGFLVGFKENNLSETDQNLLEELAKESAA